MNISRLKILSQCSQIPSHPSDCKCRLEQAFSVLPRPKQRQVTPLPIKQHLQTDSPSPPAYQTTFTDRPPLPRFYQKETCSRNNIPFPFTFMKHKHIYRSRSELTKNIIDILSIRIVYYFQVEGFEN